VLGRAIAAVVLLLLLLICLEYGHLRKVGPSRWYDRYFRAAFWVTILALLLLGTLRYYGLK
jgi:hypothetical protein